MINELHELSKTLRNEEIPLHRWHKDYKPIPEIRKNAPCIRIVISGGKVIGISSVTEEIAKGLRKYGSNQGTYPCMNLAPLYRITDEAAKKKLSELIKKPEHIDDDCIAELESWCTEDTCNWGKKIQGKYKISMINTPVKLHNVASQYEPLQTLISETQFFSDAAVLHEELKRTAFDLLRQKADTSLALSVMFYQGNKDKLAEDDFGSLSVAFDSAKLIEEGIPAVSEQFVKRFNSYLIASDDDHDADYKANAIDAFGIPFQTIEEPMPSVKLAGGFGVTLRTMFKAQHCQKRYGKIENASYPISQIMRTELQAALEWAGSSEQKGSTWINTDINEVLFAYPTSMPKKPVSFTAMFGQREDNSIAFSEQAKQFIEELKHTKDPGTDSNANRIRIFILKKLDKARTKIVYTKQTDSFELEKRSEEWTQGCANLPAFWFGQPATLYPLDLADSLNRFWKQNGETATDKFKPTPRYHGVEILMDSELSVSADLHRISENAMRIGSYLGNLCAIRDRNHPIWKKSKDMLAVMGLFLYRRHIGKDVYMDNLPYLYGQLLKAADELHALYCNVVRHGDVPPQLVGSALFQSAAEAPVRTLNILSQRIMPYYSWAKSYRLKKIMETDKESWRAGWLYRICEQTMDKLQNSWTAQTRFNAEEKAQLFIGYLAAFPKNEQNETSCKEDS